MVEESFLQNVMTQQKSRHVKVHMKRNGKVFLRDDSMHECKCMSA